MPVFGRCQTRFVSDPRPVMGGGGSRSAATSELTVRAHRPDEGPVISLETLHELWRNHVPNDCVLTRESAVPFLASAADKVDAHVSKSELRAIVDSCAKGAALIGCLGAHAPPRWQGATSSAGTRCWCYLLPSQRSAKYLSPPLSQNSSPRPWRILSALAL